MKLKSLSLGLTFGIIWGGMLFITTWLSYFTGYGKVFLETMAVSVYPGYTISPIGSIIVFFYGFVDLFIGGVLTAWLYNRFSSMSSHQK